MGAVIRNSDQTRRESAALSRCSVVTAQRIWQTPRTQQQTPAASTVDPSGCNRRWSISPSSYGNLRSLRPTFFLLHQVPLAITLNPAPNQSFISERPELLTDYLSVVGAVEASTDLPRRLRVLEVPLRTETRKDLRWNDHPDIHEI